MTPEPDRFFAFVGASAVFFALVAIGASVGIIVRRVRGGSARLLKHVLPLAISWNALSALYVWRFFSGAYDAETASDGVAISIAFAAFACGDFGLYQLWANPYAGGSSGPPRLVEPKTKEE